MTFSRMSKQVRHLASNDFFATPKCFSELQKEVFTGEPDFGGPSFI